MKKTKAAYEEFLNGHTPEDDGDWIIGGVARMYHAAMGLYGTALRKYDPIAFEVGYNEWKNL